MKLTAIVTALHLLPLYEAFVVPIVDQQIEMKAKQLSTLTRTSYFSQATKGGSSTKHQNMKKESKDPDESLSSSTTTSDDWLKRLKSKPGTIIIAPFVALFALDLVLNILAVTRRTIEYALTGQYTPLF